MIPTEHEEQVRFVEWFRTKYPSVLIFAIPNGGIRNIVTATKLKAEGVESGIPDLYIPEWHTWIEMKRIKNGKLSPAQKEKIAYLESIGDHVIVGLGWEKAKQELEWDILIRNG